MSGFNKSIQFPMWSSANVLLSFFFSAFFIKFVLTKIANIASHIPISYMQLYSVIFQLSNKFKRNIIQYKFDLIFPSFRHS